MHYMVLVDVPPPPTIYDVVNRISCYAVFCGQFICTAVRGISSSDGVHIDVSQLGQRMGLSVRVTTLGCLVGHVVCVGAKP